MAESQGVTSPPSYSSSQVEEINPSNNDGTTTPILSSSSEEDGERNYSHHLPPQSSPQEDCKNGRMVTFVDDANSLVKGNNAEELKAKCQETVDAIESYLDANMLKINTDKS